MTDQTSEENPRGNYLCINWEDISETESHCKRGFPIDETCITGKSVNCWYYHGPGPNPVRKEE